MNQKLAEKILSFLVYQGVRSFCLCPGSRSAPFVEALSSLEKELEVLYFFEERSAGFFALGRARRDLRPVAIVTTSGTAVAELLPSVIESHYSSLPLVLLTADRPPAQRKGGAPQTLKNPLALFRDYTACSLELSLKDLPLLSWNLQSLSKKQQFKKTSSRKLNYSDKGSPLFQKDRKAKKLNHWSPQQGSLHINVPFDEPLVEDFSQKLKVPKDFYSRKVSIYPLTKKKKGFEKDVKAFFHISRKPLILVGELKEQEVSFTEELLKKENGLLYLEPLSRLSHLKNRLFSGEKILNQAVTQKSVDGIIRLGGIPRVRFWRDLEKTRLPVFHLSSPPFYSGLSYKTFQHPLKRESLETLLSFVSYEGNSLKKFDREQLKKWSALLKNSPGSEPHWVWLLRNKLEEGSSIFLGNSLPVRLWDMVTLSSQKKFSVTGQGGVNGIDGLVSRFLGECHPTKLHTALIGDLSALYDLSGFWSGEKQGNWRIFIMNNFGGQIFSRLYSNPRFLNEHGLSFKPLADMWGLDYQQLNNPLKFHKIDQKFPELIEIRPDLQKTKKIFQAYDSL